MLPPGEWVTSIVRTRQIIVTEQTPHDEGLSRHPHAFPESTRPYACGRKVPCLGDIEFSPVMLPNIPSGSLRHRTIINTQNSTMRSKTETPLFIVDTVDWSLHLQSLYTVFLETAFPSLNGFSFWPFFLCPPLLVNELKDLPLAFCPSHRSWPSPAIVLSITYI